VTVVALLDWRDSVHYSHRGDLLRAFAPLRARLAIAC
jgi:hypothetical protein